MTKKAAGLQKLQSGVRTVRSHVNKENITNHHQAAASFPVSFKRTSSLKKIKRLRPQLRGISSEYSAHLITISKELYSMATVRMCCNFISSLREMILFFTSSNQKQHVMHNSPLFYFWFVVFVHWHFFLSEHWHPTGPLSAISIFLSLYILKKISDLLCICSWWCLFFLVFIIHYFVRFFFYLFKCS